MQAQQTTVDPSEIAKFEAMAAEWWDENGKFKPLHMLNPCRLDYITTQIAGEFDRDLSAPMPFKGLRILDIGCGGGILAESMAHADARVTAIDMAEGPLAVARLHQLESGAEVDYRKSTAEALAAAEPASFDVVTCLEMLEHVPDPAAVIASCKQLVKPGGHVIFSTINRNPKSFLFAVVGAEYILRLLPKGTHEYEKFIRPSELEAWARTAGLELRDSIGMQYNPFTRVYSLGDNVDVNYLMYFQRPAD